jgi:hypothetical protein
VPFLFNTCRKYELTLTNVNFITLYSKRRLDVLHLVKIVKGKSNCHSRMDTINIRMTIRQVIQFSTFRLSSLLTINPLARCVTVSNDICKFLDIFGNNIVSFQDTSSIGERCLDWLLHLVYICFQFLLFSLIYIYFIFLCRFCNSVLQLLN